MTSAQYDYILYKAIRETALEVLLPIIGIIAVGFFLWWLDHRRSPKKGA